MTENLYQPMMMRVASDRLEAPDVRTLHLEFLEESDRVRFFAAYRVGMFGLWGVPGAGESAFCIASPPTRTGYVECTFRRTGRVTSALADREVGQTLTLRGPYGQPFPLETWRGRSLVFVAGGIGLPPLRSVLWNVLDRRPEFAEVTVVYGARTAADLLYKDELAQWAERGDLRLVTTVDPGGETPDWTGRVGLVPTVLEKLAPAGAGSVALICGPPVMIKFTLPVLVGLGFAPAAIYTTLENRMKCGLGHCGRCNVGSKFVCRDGPVFSLEQLRAMETADM
jgi:sulfhydrogenase subunit gamma (sulfur reductase)